MLSTGTGVAAAMGARKRSILALAAASFLSKSPVFLEEAEASYRGSGLLRKADPGNSGLGAWSGYWSYLLDAAVGPALATGLGSFARNQFAKAMAGAKVPTPASASAVAIGKWLRTAARVASRGKVKL